jgi:hypothetical protein
MATIMLSLWDVLREWEEVGKDAMRRCAFSPGDATKE